uniref:Uncharacterized protein n=1 Tax=Arundo donax TaxID=35708 RepID=A0A0A9APF5_ARUDO
MQACSWDLEFDFVKFWVLVMWFCNWCCIV